MPRLSAGDEPVEAGRVIRQWASVPVAMQLDEWKTSKDAVDGWRAALERRGVLVLFLQLQEDLRGFSLADNLAPVIAVNTAENNEARSFSMFHELSHLASGTESSCSESARHARSDYALERWCEEVASSVLLPRIAITLYLRSLRYVPEDEFELVGTVAAAFKTSLRATALALIRLRLVSGDVYYEVQERAPILDRDKGFGRGGGQKAPQRRIREYGRRALTIVLDAFDSDQLTERDVRDYLRLDGDEIDDLNALARA
jgi:Zn-dependent peptidase ImmA (M78 family)